MIKRKEEERNEKTIRGLMKLPHNRRCINCNSMGPQYVCTNFWTFVCITCSGIHREFTHRVKSVSMAKFTKQEVEALQRGGNEHAREMFLKDWDTREIRLPDISKPDKIRAFIKDVYVNKKYAGRRSSSKPFKDMQNLNNREEERRRTDSYHSFPQSPPYENRYDGRCNWKEMERRPGSDRGLYEGKTSAFVHSPGRLQEQIYEERFANESSGSRTSDYSMSSAGDPFRFDAQSPNFQDTGYSIPPLHQVRETLVEETHTKINRYTEVNAKRDLGGFSRRQRTASSSSFGSFDSDTVSLKSINSGGMVDDIVEPEHSTDTQQAITCTFNSISHPSASVQTRNQDLFNLPSMRPSMTSPAPPLDLFAVYSNQVSETILPEKRPSEVPFSENEGWVTFDLPHHMMSASEKNKGVSDVVRPVDEAPKGSEDPITSVHNNSQWFSVQRDVAKGQIFSLTDQGHAQEDRPHSWSTFGDKNGKYHHTSFGCLPHNIEPHILIQKSRVTVDQHAGLQVPEGSFIDGLQMFAVDGTNVVTGSSFPPSVPSLTGGETEARKSTNPFDLPYGSYSEVNNNMFYNISPLQAALPNPQLPTAQLGGLTQQWVHENPVSNFYPSITQRGLAYMARQNPNSQLPNTPPQAPDASLGGNPFAEASVGGNFIQMNI